ncbi:hypothetical protein HK097_000516 [Rhizophlyctis rosea]|uniref:Uncharacterized protein n=1 Tax=Rhizophlyctis rosea TaxID=64517 RepID=A0AAD5X2I6_9FUNG|nr:hypothetical protein HK097_000516 [Rhizophlyctis rosea]
MAQNQQTMMKKQMSMQASMGMASSRDNLLWIGGIYGAIATAATLALIKHKTIPLPMRIPLVVIPIPGAYFYDMAYGSKMERIRRHQHHILEHEKHWFNNQEVDEAIRLQAANVDWTGGSN